MKKFIRNVLRKRMFKIRYIKFLKYYRENPIEFCEQYLGLEFLDYQKKYIKGLMKIELKNGNIITPIPSSDTIRSRRYRLHELLNERQYRELTTEEEELINSFTIHKPDIDIEKEYECIWISSTNDK